MADADMVSAGMQAIGSIIGGIGARSASRARARSLRAGATQARAEAGVNAGIALDEGERAAATGAVQAAASGGGLTGSALDVLGDLSGQAMFNARSALYAGTTEGRNMDYQAKVEKKAGGLALVTSLFMAGGTTLGGMSEARQTKLQNLSRRRESLASQPSGFDLKGLY